MDGRWWVVARWESRRCGSLRSCVSVTARRWRAAGGMARGHERRRQNVRVVERGCDGATVSCSVTARRWRA
eukprot:10498713-Prorocentrum_lima.AAC.1